jgi:lysyl-tRNA synthetase class 2
MVSADDEELDQVVRIERHRLGPRVHILGVRVHEWHLGAAILVGLVVVVAAGFPHALVASAVAAAIGVWLIAKDWRDIVRRQRDTAAWSLGLHRRPSPLRTLRRAEALPLLLALAAATIGTVNLLSALTPNIGWHGHRLLRVGPIQELPVFHDVAIPASAALLVSAFYLYRRRRRALQLALLLLVALGILNLLRRPDVGEAIGDFLVATLLWCGRGAFCVEHEPLSRRAAVFRLPVVAAGSLVASFLIVWIAAPGGVSLATIGQETVDLLTWQQGPLTFHDELGRLDLAIGLLGLSTFVVCAYLLFRPLAAPRALPGADLRTAAGELVRRHGQDTLSYFKLRRDKHYLFSDDRRAFLGYRIESGTLLVSGEPVGPAEALPALLSELGRFAECRGLRIAALGVSERLRPLFGQLGLHALYMGDEAIIDTEQFSLEGRAIRKVRQSVTRLEREDYQAEVLEAAQLDSCMQSELERVSTSWRAGSAERGFTMSLDALRRDHADTVIVLARDAAGQIRGFLHFVPVYGRPAMSLSVMRRERETPNGLTEFLVVRAIELLLERGVEEISLNFAAFARYLHNPHGSLQRLLGRLLRYGDSFFQIERLYRFNAKFFPRWEPRYLMYESKLGLPRTALAALWAEGQLPKLTLPTRHTKARRHATAASGPV